MRDTRDTHQAMTTDALAPKLTTWAEDTYAEHERMCKVLGPEAQAESLRKIEKAFRPRVWVGHAYDDSLPKVWLSGRAGILICVIGVLIGVGLTLLVDQGSVAYITGRWFK